MYKRIAMKTNTALYIPVERAYRSRLNEVDWENLEMGVYTTDHMLVCDFANGEWSEPKIMPYGPMGFSPTTLAFHYGQTIFEGMKAFRTEDDQIHIFRPERHHQRWTRSAERMCMPVIAKEIFCEGLRRLVEVDRKWVPGLAGSALYLRPFQIATDTKLRVRVSDNYRFAVVCSPAGAYFQAPVRLKVEREYARAVKGGTGAAKCGGNYGGALYPTQQAKEEGFDQVLWTDGATHRYVEEAGMMNVFFVQSGKLVTPPLTGSILDGITRDSLLTLALAGGMVVEERPVSVDELKAGLGSGEISEAFGSGTAAVVSQIGSISIDGIEYTLPTTGKGSVAMRLKQQLDDIRYGRAVDPYGWNRYI